MKRIYFCKTSANNTLSFCNLFKVNCITSVQKSKSKVSVKDTAILSITTFFRKCEKIQIC